LTEDRCRTRQFDFSKRLIACSTARNPVTRNIDRHNPSAKRRQLTGAAIAGGLLIHAFAIATACADPLITPQRIVQLRHAYYGYAVLEYCGGLTREVHDGFERRIGYLLLTADIDAETNRRIKIGSWSDADYQYGNHGLSGFRHWCASDGRQAVRAFLAFRRGGPSEVSAGGGPR
jgi:hypothetical protein